MHNFKDRVAVLGFPDSYNQYQCHSLPDWTPKTLTNLIKLGFNHVQLNLAWGARPDDEPLNLEDILEIPSSFSKQTAEYLCLSGSAALLNRQDKIKKRSVMAHEAGLRTIFHFGAPYNRHAFYGDNPPNCIMDSSVHERYRYLVRELAEQYPDIDDILVYTYDQDAWLCSEFGTCPRCNGIPLHDRLPAFLESLRSAWASVRPNGRMWWEPWELSAGQVYSCLQKLDNRNFGLALHANIAEAMSAIVADAWLVNTCRQSQKMGIPVWVEWFLGAVSEELEPLANMAHPLTIWRGLMKLNTVPGITGIKEYYGLMPEREYDPNLSMTSLFLKNPEMDGQTALVQLAEQFDQASGYVMKAWELSSEAMERYPWDCSWLGRQIGRARTDHSLSGALLKPMVCPTPSWQSTRGTIFMRTEDTAAHPWMMEDVGLRAGQAAEFGKKALQQIELSKEFISTDQCKYVQNWANDLSSFVRRALSYSYHLRATCIAIAARQRLCNGMEIQPEMLFELRTTLENSRDNHIQECIATNQTNAWAEMDQALATLRNDPIAFFQLWLCTEWMPLKREPFSLKAKSDSKGTFSLTSQ